MDWSRALAFQNARLELSPTISQFSDIDGHEVNALSRRQELGSFRAFNFSAKIDPVATMLVQNHRETIPDFYGLDDLVPEEPDQAGRDDPGRRAGRAVGQVSSWRARAGNLDVLRWPRSGGPATPDRRRPDRPVAPPPFAGVPTDPEQRAVSRGEEEGTQEGESGASPSESRIAAEVRLLLAAEIRAAGGREVSFVADVDAIGIVTGARAVARGTVHMVLALPGVAQRGQMLLHNHPTGHLEPSEADLSVAARLHDGGVGFGILDNTAERLYVVVEVPRERSAERLDPYAVVETLGEHGPVARVLGQYEDRPSQRDMAAYIADGYNDGGVLVLEAGTGVGKSFAYLVPALAWSRATASEPSSARTRSTCRSSWSGRTSRCCARRWRWTAGRRSSPCSRAGGTTCAFRAFNTPRVRSRACWSPSGRTNCCRWPNGRHAPRMAR